MATRPTLDYIIHLAQEASDIIKEASSKHHTIQTKVSASDLVTETDVAVEHFLMSKIKADFPTHKFFCEETEHIELTDDPTWVIDPVDGTANFVHTFPIHACSIAYCEKAKPVMGVIAIPQHNEIFSAERGKGAYLNGKTIHVAPKRTMSESLISTGFMVGFLHSGEGKEGQQAADVQLMREIMIKNFVSLLDHSRDIRRTGACAPDLCYVACGRVDAFCEIGPHEWDYAAGQIIVEEAGGILVNYKNEPFELNARCVVAASSVELATEVTSHLEAPSISSERY